MPFSRPSVSPEMEEEEIAFDELEDLLEDREMSAAVGWAIQLRSLLLCKEKVREMRGVVRGSFDGRLGQNWAFLLICAEQVCIFISSNMPQYTMCLFCSCSLRQGLKMTFCVSSSLCDNKGYQMLTRMTQLGMKLQRSYFRH